MVKSKNIIAGLGVVAGLGMALLPLGGVHATDCTGTGDQVGCVAETPAHYIRAHVGEVISIAMSSNRPMTGALANTHSRVEITPGGSANLDLIHTVTVNSNARGGYKLLLKANKTNLELITAYDSDKKATDYNDQIFIPGLVSANALTADDSEGWGYRVGQYTKSGDTWTAPTLSGNFNPVPTAYGDTSVVASTYKDGTTNPYHTETTAYTEKFDFGYGIKADADQPSGSYEAAVTYKAVANVLGDA